MGGGGWSCARGSGMAGCRAAFGFVSAFDEWLGDDASIQGDHRRDARLNALSPRRAGFDWTLTFIRTNLGRAFC